MYLTGTFDTGIRVNGGTDESSEEDDADLYFSFTLNAGGKLCADVYDAELGLFSDTYYSDDEA